MRSASVKLAIGLISIFFSTGVWAAGSLAIDSLQGTEYGFSFNHPSFDVADQRTLRECGASCSIVKRFQNECAAYAADQASGSTVYGWWQGGTSGSTVQQRALSECRAHGGSSCIVRAWGCDTITATDKEIATQSSKPANTKPTKNASVFLGEWTADYTTSRGYSAKGIMNVTEFVGKGVYRGVLTWTYAGGENKAKEDVLISVNGDTVTINGSNPIVFIGRGTYDADNYTTTMIGGTVLNGVNRDSSGNEGIVVFVKSSNR